MILGAFVLGGAFVFWVSVVGMREIQMLEHWECWSTLFCLEKLKLCMCIQKTSVLLLNNPQNSEMKFCENMKLTCWKSS